MAYIIPNSTETGSGQRYANINQAEPDSVDIETLGNRANWVRSGLVTSITGESVSVASGVVVINNTPYLCSGTASAIPIARASVGARIDLIVARLSGSSVTITKLTGIDTATNPIFPKSKSVLPSGGTSSNYDPTTDVLVASLYVSSAETTSANLVDKRIIDGTPITRSSASMPTVNATLDVIGDVVVYDNVTYVRHPSSWVPLASHTYAQNAGLPVGSVFVWSGRGDTSPGASFLPCDGQDVPKATYSELFSKIRSNPAISIASDNSIYGIAATPSLNFKLPNLNGGRVPTGTTTAANIGSNTGNDSNQVILTQANLAEHRHLNQTTYGHGTNLHHNNNQPITTTGESGHRHKGHQHGHQGALMYRTYDDHNEHHVINTSGHGTSAFHVDVYRVNEKDPVNPFSTTDVDDTNEENLGASLRFDQSSGQNRLGNFTQTDFASTSHTHQTTIASHSISDHILDEQAVGSGTPVNITPMGVFMRWYIKAL